MKQSLTTYLEAVGPPNTIVNRIAQIVDFYARVFKFDPDEIFVTETVNEDGQRIYDSLWLVSHDFLAEAKNFISLDSFDMTPLEPIKHLTFTSRDYNFAEASEKSRLTLQFSMTTGISGTLKASGQNCDLLVILFQNYLAPKVMR